MLLRVTDAHYVGDYRLRLSFNNGTQGIVDLEPELYGEIFEPLRDKRLFREFTVTSRTIEWPNGADFAPEFLFEAAALTSNPDVRNTILYPLPSQTDWQQRLTILHEAGDLPGYAATRPEEP
jgi:hypothetical protein